MIWKKVEGYSNYEVSDQGFVRNTMTGRILKFDVGNKGYHRVTLSTDGETKKYLIHRLVMYTFVEVSDLQVNHINGIKSDNRLDNLEYLTCSENHLHAQKLGLRPVGSKRNTALLNEDVVHSVCQMFCEGRSSRYILNYGLSEHLKKHMIDNIRRRRTWKHVSCNYEW